MNATLSTPTSTITIAVQDDDTIDVCIDEDFEGYRYTAAIVLDNKNAWRLARLLDAADEIVTRKIKEECNDAASKPFWAVSLGAGAAEDEGREAPVQHEANVEGATAARGVVTTSDSD